MKKLTAAVILTLFAGYIVLTPGATGPEAAGQAKDPLSGSYNVGNGGQTFSERLWPPTGTEFSVRLGENQQAGQVRVKDLSAEFDISRPARKIEVWPFKE